MERRTTNKEQNSNFCVFVIFITEIPYAFIMGFHLTALNSLTPVIKVFINESFQHRYEDYPPTSTTDLIFTLSQSCLVWGCLAGSLLVKIMLSKISRKMAILLVHILFILSSVLMGPIAKYYHSYESLIVGRFLNGVARSIGFSAVLVFIAETTCRSRLGFYQSPLSTMQFVSCAVGISVGHAKALGTAQLWMWIMCVPILASLLYIVCWPVITETPVYLLKHKGRSGALLVMKKLRAADVNHEFEVLEEESKCDAGETEMALMTLLRSPHYRFQFFVTIITMCSPQFGGVQAITMYSNSVLLNAGVAEEYVTLVSMGLFLQCILAFAVSSPLQKKFGTKKVLVFGLFIVSSSYTLFIVSDKLRFKYPSLNLLVIVSMFLTVSGLQIGPLFSITALPSELTTASSRPTIIFYSQCTFWILGGIISFVFPYSSEPWGSFSLIPFLVLITMLIPFAMFVIPETHRRTSVAIQRSFRKKSLQSASAIFNISFNRSQSDVKLGEMKENECQDA
ncbi:solute carrier family 2, facilitated glucose transporter member 1-like isoform X1 [Styela clava]